jgi:Domain of unknown function (DUF6265)
MNCFVQTIFASCALAIATPAAAASEASIAELAWLEGVWEGQGVDGAPATEVYSPAAGGQMVGHFRQLKPDGTAMFFELITIGVEGGKLTYSLKHFNPDLTGWEDRDTVRRFPITKAASGRWEFSGIVYERIAVDSMTVTVAVEGEQGKSQKLIFHFKRRGH